MPEGSPDKSPDYNKIFHEVIDAPEGVRLLSRLTGFDDGRGKLYDHLSNVATNFTKATSGEQQSTMELDDIAARFEGMIRAMLASGDSIDDIVEMTIRIMFDDNTQRRELINGLLNDPDAIAASKHEDLRKEVEDCIKKAESTEGAVETIVQTYHLRLAEDVSKFMQVIVDKQHDHGVDQATLEIKKDMKDHVTEVAKIALGVSIAFAVNKLINRNT